ncbi:hypothetical protein FJT64_016401 [Amphibalanus amphitrite]|uniref:Ig-like domain-containing protein n=1 Tax=Amphibalanus amphitrite TaxID=1232801 RepID=A0A6A4X3Z3_AMPAM|nr:hypothetical protein FJT64_016401 [Amphibalanus amphitrite]
MAVLRRRCTWPQLALLAVRVISLVVLASRRAAPTRAMPPGSALTAALTSQAALIAFQPPTQTGVIQVGRLCRLTSGSEHPSLLDPPIVVRNGTNASVVLDCAYTLPPDDTLLHVKWFHIRSAYTLVFQWIHGQRPQALGPLRHRVNLSFTASETANERYRAMQILRPTVELSGRYMCKVTSTRHDFTRHKRLVVYTSPREMSISEVQPGDNLVNITCHVSGMYPEPRVELYRGANSRTMVPIEGLNKYVSWRDGLYDVTAFWVTRHELLQDHTLFECIMRISDTNYMERREISYSSA